MMDTPHETEAAPEHPLGEARWRLVVSLLLAAAIIAFDILYMTYRRGSPYSVFRFAPFLAAFGFYGHLAGWDPDRLALRIMPRQPIAYWLKATAAIGGSVLALALAATGIAWLAGFRLPMPDLFTRSDQILPWFLTACLMAPIVEEPIYRFVVCVPVDATFGRWPAIAASGILFAGLHVLYGNPAPTNMVAGFFLAWAYLKSRSLLVPIILHALGNLSVGVAATVIFYWGG